MSETKVSGAGSTDSDREAGGGEAWLRRPLLLITFDRLKVLLGGLFAARLDSPRLASTRLDSLRFHVEAVWLLLLISFITKLISMLAFCFFGFLA